MTDTESSNSNPDNDSFNKKRQSRFVWGLLIGISIGTMAAAIVAVAAMVIANPLGATMRIKQVIGRTSKIAVVRASGPWLKMIDENHGRIIGVSGGGGSSGTGMAHGAISQFNLVRPTEQDGARASLTVSIYVTPKTKLTMGGKSWKPQDQTSKTPSTRVFDGLQDEPGDTFLEMRELTIDFRLEGHDLVAEQIDASKKRKDPPSGIWN